MVKFSKELEAQLIPEWKEAFVNYWELKKNVKRIKLLRESKRVHDYSNASADRCVGFNLLDPFRHMATKVADKFFGGAADDGRPIIQVTISGMVVTYVMPNRSLVLLLISDLSAFLFPLGLTLICLRLREMNEASLVPSLLRQ